MAITPTPTTTKSKFAGTDTTADPRLTETLAALTPTPPVISDDTRALVTAVFQNIADRIRGAAGQEFQLIEEPTEPPVTPPADEFTPDSPQDPTSPTTKPTSTPRQPSNTPSSSAQAWGGFQNGRIPREALTPIGQGSHRLEAQAASAWQRMKTDAAKDGINLTVSDSYRTYESQVALANDPKKKNLAARPGTSVHGWGRAVDIKTGREWIQRNGYRYGWIWPTWAQPGGSKPEPWHFEFVPPREPLGAQ